MTTNDAIPQAVRDVAMTNLAACLCDEPESSRIETTIPRCGPTIIEHVCQTCRFIIPKGGQVWAQEAFPNFRVYLSLAGPVGVAHGVHLMMLSEPETRGSMAHVGEGGDWLWESRKLAAHLRKHRFMFKGDLADILYCSIHPEERAAYEAQGET